MRTATKTRTKERTCQGVKLDGTTCTKPAPHVGRDIYNKPWRLCSTHLRIAQRHYEIKRL